jgi:predicted oxidoreductase
MFKDKQTPLWQKLNSIAKSYNVQPSSVAIAWLIRHPATIMPINGSNDLQRIKRLSEALSFDLSREEWFELLQIATGKEIA